MWRERIRKHAMKRINTNMNVDIIIYSEWFPEFDMLNGVRFVRMRCSVQSIHWEEKSIVSISWEFFFSLLLFSGFRGSRINEANRFIIKLNTKYLQDSQSSRHPVEIYIIFLLLNNNLFKIILYNAMAATGARQLCASITAA